MSLISQQLVANSDFSCTLTTLFSTCPTLPAIATRILGDQWREREISQHSPETLYLRSRNTHHDERPLSHVLIERFCQRTDLFLHTAQDILVETPNDVSGLVIDLGKVQALINDCGPLLLEDYRQALVDYWNQPDSSGTTTWQRYSDYLNQQLLTSISEVYPGSTAFSLCPLATELAHYPSAQARRLAPGGKRPRVSLLELDLTQASRLNELAGALLIEPSTDIPDTPVLLYTLTGRLMAFDSRQALMQALGQIWPELANKQAQLHLQTQDGHAFDAMATQVLEQQLAIIPAIGERYMDRTDTQRLCLDLSHLTSMLDLCPYPEQQKTLQAGEKLPSWLRTASEQLRNEYAHLLIESAQSHVNAKGAFWLEDVDDAQYFAYTKINQYITADHPDHDLEPWHVQVINHQTTAVTLPTGAPDGVVVPVVYDLAQLMIGNWGLILPGRVELRHAQGGTLPAWLNEAYLRKMVEDLNIGKAYPQMLQAKLLDDEVDRLRRQALLAEQLRSQLPAAALELHLQDGQLSQRAFTAVREVLTPPQGRQATWVIRALGLVREPGSTPDHPLNCWLIEAADTSAPDICLLYRPLHEKRLVEFAHRASLLQALASPGALQDDIVQRLAEDERKVYDNGGFIEPNLPGLMEMTLLGVPYNRPVPVTLAIEAALVSPVQAIYLACVTETIDTFKAQSATSEQARWEQWKSLGWLMLNLTLPLISGPLGTAVWLTQIGVALGQYLHKDVHQTPAQDRIKLVNVLVNIGLALFAHTAPRVTLQRSAETLSQEPVPAPTQAPKIEATKPARLDFSWGRADGQLDSTAQAALAALRSQRSPETLGLPIASGERRGLYHVGEDYFALLDGSVYSVVIDEQVEQPRIVGESPPHASGPWLRRGPTGKWQPDLRLRLRGGMPGGARRRALLAEKAAQREALKKTVFEQNRQTMDKLNELSRLEGFTRQVEDENLLKRSLSKIDDLEQFWDSFVDNQEKYAALTGHQPGNDAKAQWEFQRFYVKQVRTLALSKIALTRLGDEPQSLATAQAHADYVHFLEATDPYLDTLVSNTNAIGKPLLTLERLAGHQGVSYDRYRNAVSMMNAPLGQKILTTRILRLENTRRRFNLLTELPERASFLFKRCWNNLALATSQRLRLYDLPPASEELNARLLHDIDKQFIYALRRLDSLKQEVTQHPEAKAIVERIEQDLRAIAYSVEQDLQEYPPISTVEQLQQRNPGLIETDHHGLLLGKQREDNEGVVDIFDNNQQPIMTFQQQGKGNAWTLLENNTPEPEPVQPTTNLKQLFQQAQVMKSKAQQSLAKLESKSAENYLPIEFEEEIDWYRRPLAKKVALLEVELAKETELPRATTERYNVQLQALQHCLQTLDSKRVELRTQATLRHKPLQSGLQYLVEQGNVQIQQQLRRRPLTAVPGKPQDYLDEYTISHNGEPLWYAHFHYPGMDTAKPDFVAGHLKTKEQRLLRGQTVVDPVTQKSEFVHRGALTRAAASKYFFEPG
jgi:hypothetical protein